MRTNNTVSVSWGSMNSLSHSPIPPDYLESLVGRCSFIDEITFHLGMSILKDLVECCTIVTQVDTQPVNLNRSRIYIVLEDATLLTTKNIQQPNNRAQTQARFAYASQKNTPATFSSGFRKLTDRSGALENNFEVVREFKGPFVHGEPDFFEQVQQRQKESYFLLLKARCSVVCINRTSMKRSLYSQLLTLYMNKVHFLRSFPCLNLTYKSVFDLHYSDFKFHAYNFDHIVYDSKMNEPRLLYLMRSGEVELSIDGKMKLYRMTGQQIFGQSKEPCEEARVISENTVIYHLDVDIFSKLTQSIDVEDDSDIRASLQSPQNYFQNVKALRLLRQNDTNCFGSRVKPNLLRPIFKSIDIQGHKIDNAKELKQSFMSSSLFTMQFNNEITQNGNRKKALLTKLLPKGQNRMVMHEFKQIERKRPDMTQIKRQCQRLKNLQFNKVKKERQHSFVVEQYNDLVNAGLESQIHPERLKKLDVRDQLCRLNERRKPRQYNIIDILKKCR